MLKSFIVFLRFFLFWILFFFLDRIVFLASFSDRLSNTEFSQIAATFFYALRLDASMIAYLAAIPLLVYIVLLFIPKITAPKWLIKAYVFFFIFIFSVITVINLNLYREWGSKINFRAFDIAINSPKEAIASSSSSPVLIPILLFLGVLSVSIFIANKLIDYKIYDQEKSLLRKISGGFLALALLVLIARGGWQLSPVNQSMSYFSTETILNHAAVNTEWNLIQDVINNEYGSDNPYKYYSKEESEKIVNSLFTKPDTETVSILSNPKPNIVFIIVESFTAQLIGSLGGEKDVTPVMNKISNDGLLFTQIYAAAGRTDKGVVATLSAFPSQAIRSIMKQNNKQEKLPGIAQELKANGYRTSFYYGGESEFFNMKSYVLSHGYQTMIDQHSFAKKDMNSKWGTYDEKVFTKNVSDLDKVREPFFSTILTLTNHEPFELPVKAHFKGEGIEDKFRSTAYYTDSCIGAYLSEAKKKKWYKNTLFVVLADHSHRLPYHITEYDPKRYHIPLLFLGDVIKPEFRGKRMDKIGNQTDLVATILSQLKIDSHRYKWSRDLLNPGTREFGFFCWDNGFAFATKDQIVSFDNVGKTVILRKNAAMPLVDNQLLYYGKAYMQKVFQEYLDY
jgi:phosphoglycerol transferase MdoB-like AlkP superfamily enzyme